MQAHALHILLSRSAQVNLNVMSTDILIPPEAHIAVFAATRVPLRHLIRKVLPKLRLLILLTHTRWLWRHGSLRLWLRNRLAFAPRGHSPPSSTPAATLSTTLRSGLRGKQERIRKHSPTLRIPTLATLITPRRYFWFTVTGNHRSRRQRTSV